VSLRATNIAIAVVGVLMYAVFILVH